MRRTVTIEVEGEQSHTLQTADSVMEVAAFILQHADRHAGKDVVARVRCERDPHDLREDVPVE